MSQQHRRTAHNPRITGVLTAVILSAALSGTHATGADRLPPGAAEFIDGLVREDGFDRSELIRLLSQAKKRQSILDAIARPAEGLPWWKYRRIFLKDQRVSGGVDYWQKNRASLQKAEQEFGVPPQIIVAIIGVETMYGRNTGRYPVLDALHTLGFYYPKRADFFRKELGEFLRLSREEALDPTEPLGSYAGAMGRPQFISSSYRAYAVDFDGDGKRDIWENDRDVIGSVGNYLARHGWRRGGPITARAYEVDDRHARFVEAGMKPSFTVGDLRREGVNVSAVLDDSMPTSLIELETRTGQEHWLGLENFYAITRYNHSNLYAMAVYQLSREILALHRARNDVPGNP
jgi:membrane-bound lytic murein transglycosylase B